MSNRVRSRAQRSGVVRRASRVARDTFLRTVLPFYLPYCVTLSLTELLIIRKIRYNEAADAYSFGLLLWELANRQTVFAEHNGVQVALPLHG